MNTKMHDVNQSTPKGRMALIPRYVLREQQGLYVNLSHFPVGGGFDKFVDRLFGDGFRFVGLDYPLLMNLLYDYDGTVKIYGQYAKVKLADDIVDFPTIRKALYSGVKLVGGGQSAEYVFEPLALEEEIVIPVYGEKGADGIRPVVATERISELHPTSLNLDEFIAEMWLKRIRFGIDVDKVASVIYLRQMGAVTIASQMGADDGSDAEILEASEVLRRENASQLLPKGKADLRKFQNRFPKIEKGTRLLRKKLRVAGKPGCKVNGERVPPKLAKDVDLSALAGEGTRIQIINGEECIVAVRNGILALDMDANRIEVNDIKDNNTEINAAPTGDISLAEIDFAEHGEVPEGSSVEGENMKFFGDVFGSVTSKNGHVLLEKDLAGGCVQSFNGDVTSNGRAVNAIIEVHDKRAEKTAGKISLNFAESCLILGHTVSIKHAINCEVVAENVEIGVVEGCSVAAKTVKIGSSNVCRRREVNIAMVLPDVTEFEAKIGQVQKSIEKCEKVIQEKDQEAAKITADPEVAKYLTMAAGIKQSGVTLTEAQQENWNKTAGKFKFAKADTSLARLNADKQDQLKLIHAFRHEIAILTGRREKMGSSIGCTISEVVGNTLVRTLPGTHEILELQKLNGNELKLKLRDNGQAQDRIFFNDEGGLDWKYTLPEITTEAA